MHCVFRMLDALCITLSQGVDIVKSELCGYNKMLISMSARRNMRYLIVKVRYFYGIVICIDNSKELRIVEE